MRESLNTDNKTGFLTSDSQTTVDIGDVIRIQYTDGLYYGEIINLETGDVGELLVFRYLKPNPQYDAAPLFTLKRPFNNG